MNPQGTPRPGKVILVGSAGVGKSCLVCRLAGSFSDQPPSLGPAYSEITVSIGELSVTLDIWDTAGQEQFRATCIPYFRSAKVAIVCFTFEEKASIDEWIRTVRDIEPSCKILLALTKCDLLEPAEENEIIMGEQQLLAQYEANALFITSALSDLGVQELFQRAGQIVLESPLHWESSALEGDRSRNDGCAC
jgi:small GTP-binding protein